MPLHWKPRLCFIKLIKRTLSTTLRDCYSWASFLFPLINSFEGIDKREGSLRKNRPEAFGQIKNSYVEINMHTESTNWKRCHWTYYHFGKLHNQAYKFLRETLQREYDNKHTCLRQWLFHYFNQTSKVSAKYLIFLNLGVLSNFTLPNCH